MLLWVPFFKVAKNGIVLFISFSLLRNCFQKKAHQKLCNLRCRTMLKCSSVNRFKLISVQSCSFFKRKFLHSNAPFIIQ